MSHPLASLVTGPVLTPDEEGFADEVAPHNRAVVNSPDVVVGATSTQDVVAAVRWAAEQRVPLTVLATGHGATTPVTSGVLLTTRRLGGVEVDPDTRVATIGAGAAWTDVVPVADAHGLTPVAGSSTNVGVVGYLLGGGIGPFARSHGYSSDRLESLTVVTGTGEVVEASADEHPDLFWALRGGKVGLGVVTQVRLRLVAIPELYAGTLFFDAEHIETALRGWLAWTATADAETTTSAAIIRFPDFEAVPPFLRGRTALTLRVARPGDEAAGEAATAPLRALAPTFLDTVGVLPVARVPRRSTTTPSTRRPAGCAGSCSATRTTTSRPPGSAWSDRTPTSRSWPSSCGTSPAPRAWTCPAGRPSRGGRRRSSPVSSASTRRSSAPRMPGRGGRRGRRPSHRGRRRSSTRTSPGRAPRCGTRRRPTGWRRCAGRTTRQGCSGDRGLGRSGEGCSVLTRSAPGRWHAHGASPQHPAAVCP